MAYNDLKQHEGRLYSGMMVGGRHVWEYTGGLWDERKAAPDRWTFTFSSVKRRTRSAPEGSGVLPGSQFHRFVIAHQKVRKLDADAYETFMEGAIPPPAEAGGISRISPKPRASSRNS